MWANFFKTAFRNLIKYKTYTIINILGLAIGLAIFIALALYIQFELSFDGFHQNSDRIYRVEQIMNEGDRIERMSGCPTPLWKALKRDFPEIEASMRVIPNSGIDLVSNEGDQFSVNSFFVESSFLKAFSFNMLQGNQVTALAEPNNIVITRETALRLFNTEDALGETYNFNDTPLKVTGIIENVPKNSHLDFDVLFSVTTLETLYGDDEFQKWGNNWVPLYVMLSEDHNIHDFNQKIKNILKVYYYEETLNELETRQLTDIHLYCDYPNNFDIRGNINSIYILSAIALFILIMASVNFTNLALAYSVNRTREVGLRKINGASRSLLIKQFLTENMLLVMIALVFAFILFEVFRSWFNQLVNRDLSFVITQNLPLFLVIICIGIIIGLISGLYPATVLSKFQPNEVIKGKGFSGRNKQILRKALIVIQFVFSVFFIISTLEVIRQVNYMKNKDLGYEPENVIRINFSDTSMARVKYLSNEILKNSDVHSVSVHDYPIVKSTNWTRVSWDGAVEEEYIRINDNYSDHYFIETYKMELVDGEGFTGPQKGTSWEGNEVIINEAAVKRMKLEHPIGKWIRYGGDYRGNTENGAKIVGVVKDFHFISVHNIITPMMIRLYNEEQTGWSFSVRIEGKDLKATLSLIEQKFNEVFPGQAFDYHFVDEFHARMYAEEQKLANVIMNLSLIAILIACMGVFGIISFTTSRRTREVMIRKVLGSSILSVNMLFAMEYIKLIILANIITWPLVFMVVNNWMQSFPYHVDFSILPYLTAILVTLLFALISMVFLTTRTALINPANILRYE